MTAPTPSENELALILRELKDIQTLAELGKGDDETTNIVLESIADHADNVEQAVRSLGESMAFDPEELEVRHLSFTKRLARLQIEQQDHLPDTT